MLKWKLFFVLLIVAFPTWAATVDDGLDVFQQRDFEAARDIWLPLAEQGDGRAAYYISLLYAQGKGVPKDSSQAMEFLVTAAENGHAMAQFNLGNHYNQGKWVDEDPEKAARWWHEAGEQNMRRAQHNLATLYLIGRGVAQDINKARYWYERAAENGSTPSALMLEQIESDFVAGQIPAPSTAEESRTGASADAAEPEKIPATTPEAPSKTEQAISAEEPKVEVSPAEPEVVSRTTPVSQEVGVLGHDWINSRPEIHYTLQLLAGDSEKALRKLLQRHEFDRPVVIYHYPAKGTTFYALAYGDFDSLTSARSGIAELPKSLAGRSPWIRQFIEIQRLINKTGD